VIKILNTTGGVASGICRSIVGNMVLYYETSHEYSHNFETTSLAYLNRYPNPYAKHVKSCDTLECYVDKEGCLRTTKLVVKTGRLPQFIKPFLGSSLDSWIIERSIIDPSSRTMKCYTANVDHRKFIKIEESLHYSSIKSNLSTVVNYEVKFSSNFLGFTKKIEEWSRNKFHNNLKNTREGLKFVMNKLTKNVTTSNL
jgi:hypothetical protein